MNRPSHEDVKAMFFAACETAPDHRDAFLVRQCGEDPNLLAEVQSLLRHIDEATSQVLPVTGRDPLPMNTRIGPFKLLHVLGEGGMGMVYLAQQEHPVRRRVALKIIKPGMDSKQVVARFESERQMLAMMDHPSVAKVFDAGTTDDGRPFFAMELVKGVPILQYCDDHRVPIAKRLELFVRVCHAVQHAHQKGIIHRDIKPSNVMVTLGDGKPVPKVIDFGVAKAICERLTDKTFFTEFQQLIGTPEYMSPEQAGVGGLDVDTRSDIYSLGVLLYAMITGTTPFDGRALRSAGFAEIQRIVRDVEPEKPTARLTTLLAPLVRPSRRPRHRAAQPAGPPEGEHSIRTVCRNRATDPKSLLREAYGDLDWIVMKCLEKDRTRRYETANALAMDVIRHLNDEPVLASPPSANYRLRKFGRRNRGVLIAATAITVAVMVGMVLGISGWVQAIHERDEANVARGRLELEVSLGKQMADLLGTIMLVFDRGPDFVVDAKERSIDAERQFGSDSVEAADCLNSLGVVLTMFGHSDEAVEQFTRALALRRTIRGPDHAETIMTRYNMAIALRSGGRCGEALHLWRENIEVAIKLLRPDHWVVGRFRVRLGECLTDLKRIDDAELELLEGNRILQNAWGKAHVMTYWAKSSLIHAYEAGHRFELAEEWRHRRRHGSDSVASTPHPSADAEPTGD